MAGEFASGDRLPSERLLCIEFSVSRPVIREALRSLEERGLISVHPSRGSFVRTENRTDLAAPLRRVALRSGTTPRDLVAARVMLECTAVDLAVQNAADSDLDAITDALNHHRVARGLVQVTLTDLRFHTEIIRAGGNPVIEIMYGSIRELVAGLMMRSHSDPIVHRAGDPLHDEICNALIARDARTARTAMEEHLRLALDLYGDDLDRPIADVLAGEVDLAAILNVVS